jgi:hypothetical protein
MPENGYLLRFADAAAALATCPTLFAEGEDGPALTGGAMDRSGTVYETAPVSPVYGEVIDPETGEPEITTPGTPGTLFTGFVVMIPLGHPAAAEALAADPDPFIDPAEGQEAYYT